MTRGVEWTFKRDTAFRKQFFVPDSFAHPAKMDAQLLIRIVEEYTKPGEVILDPMAGSGTMMLACPFSFNTWVDYGSDDRGHAWLDCKMEKCALWDDKNETCSLKTIGIGLYRLIETMENRPA